MVLLLNNVMLFAIEAHKNQKRKYTGEPYISHPAEVAAMVHAVGGTIYQVAAAWLHDTIEDCGVTKQDIEDKFGWQVAEYVDALSDYYTGREWGNRDTRKRLEAERLGRCDSEIQTIKYADLISNTRSIVSQDAQFAKVYLAEKKYALECMKYGNMALRQLALDTLQAGETHLLHLHLSRKDSCNKQN